MISNRSILVIGSGLMAESLISYLLINPLNHIHIASNILEDAKKLAVKQIARCTFSQIRVQDSSSLKPLVQASDIVISYIPAFLHLHVAKVCLQIGRNLVTASYITKQMQALDEQVKNKGLIFLNQLGLDPGIDHLATMKVIQEVAHQGGKILQYESWCGGLPSPCCCDNPLGYKFTWSPIGAFRALKNKAIFIKDAKQFEVEASDLLYSSSIVELNQALTLEGYPNRDSVSYKEVYGLKDATKVLRGTLRYHGFTELINSFKQIGYFDETPVQGDNWLQYTQILLEKQEGNTLQQKIKNRTVLNVKHYKSDSQQVNERRYQRIIRGLKYFGFLTANKFYDAKFTNLQNLIKLLQPKLNLRPGETDLVAMQHRFLIQINGRRLLRKSSLIQIGERKGFSAMSLTVATPTAIGAQLILSGAISQRGVIRPIYKDIYEPTISLLQKAGIHIVEQDEQL